MCPARSEIPHSLTIATYEAATDSAVQLYEASPGPFVLGRSSSENADADAEYEDEDEKSPGLANRLVSALKS